jgi:predicted RNA-binding protein YlxR (DUF448 family)
MSGGELVIDRERRLGGRGVHLCPDARCAELARRRGSLGRRLRRAVTVPEDLERRVEVEAATAAWKN